MGGRLGAIQEEDEKEDYTEDEYDGIQETD